MKNLAAVLVLQNGRWAADGGIADDEAVDAQPQRQRRYVCLLLLGQVRRHLQ